MTSPEIREYKMEIDPKILEFLGPSLYTNIYYVLAELVANAYDANAKNVYIVEGDNEIIVEDDGNGMSYNSRDVDKYLDVAVETRTTKDDVYVEGSNKKRKKLGRKGIGKLAALAVSENVWVKTIKDKDSSGFILTRHVGPDRKLKALNPDEITFWKGEVKHGTSVAMKNPHYKLDKDADDVKRNLIKMFPFVNKDFRIHIHSRETTAVIDNFDSAVIKDLGALITLGKEHGKLAKYFHADYTKKELSGGSLLEQRGVYRKLIELKTRSGVIKNYDLEIEGWIGIYRTTRNRKKSKNDFPDNFISLLSNGKLGEYNILSVVGKNKLQEVFVVGQLNVDLFEDTELPDIALSNRQGYKSDDERYQTVIKYVRDTLLPDIIQKRNAWVKAGRRDKDLKKEAEKKALEAKLRAAVDKYRRDVTALIAKRIIGKVDNQEKGQEIIANALNVSSKLMGLKSKVDSNKRRILICHSSSDISFADIIFNMLAFNNVPYEDIIYTSSSHAECLIPEDDGGVFAHLKNFFVDSISNEKIFVIYVTSKAMAASWYAVTEVGAGWITESTHKIFNLEPNKPLRPLDTDQDWQKSSMNGEKVTMKKREFNKFVEKILDVCKKLGYTAHSRAENEAELSRVVRVK